MRQVILKIHVSLDGYIRSENEDNMDWVFRTYDDDLKGWEVESLWQAGTHIMGRNLYFEMAEYWPSSTEEYAEPMNTIPKVVFSKTLKHADWNNTRIASGDLAAEINLLKQETGNDILLHGGADFTHSLTKLSLIDEYRLIIHPVVLSAGLPLFTGPLDLNLVDSRIFPSGSVLMAYRRA
jgi:dihydrofolate reductase